MRHLFSLTVVVLTACQSPAPPPHVSTAADSVEIQRSFRDLVAAFERTSNPDSAADLYVAGHTVDAVLMFPGQAPLIGRAAIRPVIRDIAAGYRFSFPRLETQELVVVGDWAFHRFNGEALVQPRAGGAVTRESRKYLDIWRRDADRRWRIARHIFNVNQ
jgi:ketosteroid isomerase-like protein